VERLHPDDLAKLIEAMGSPWLSANEAADYLRCPLSPIRESAS
jgi:hypothetical protein